MLILPKESQRQCGHQEGRAGRLTLQRGCAGLRCREEAAAVIRCRLKARGGERSRPDAVGGDCGDADAPGCRKEEVGGFRSLRCRSQPSGTRWKPLAASAASR